MANYSQNPFGSATLQSATNNPFGSATMSSKMDISADLAFINKNKNKEAVVDILNSAVGDFAERPLQIMIREIAKNFLIFTPIGWIILLFIIGRKYKSDLGNAAGKLNGVFDSALAALGIQPKKST